MTTVGTETPMNSLAASVLPLVSDVEYMPYCPVRAVPCCVALNIPAYFAPPITGHCVQT